MGEHYDYWGGSAAIPVPDAGDGTLRARVKKWVRGHTPKRASANEWRCKCGIALGATRAEARRAMSKHRADLSVCQADGCHSWPLMNGMCSPHHYQGRRVTPATDQRFWSRVEEQENGCWLWIAGAIGAGYGRFAIAKYDIVPAHQYAYRALVGEIPEGLVLDHLCRNRRCVNPDHLDPVTERVNIIRGTSPSAVNAKKTHCKRGHQLSGENITINSNGARECRACRRLRDAEKAKQGVTA